MNYKLRNSDIRLVKIFNIQEETSSVKSIFFRDKICLSANPGQFVMVWIPEVDEVPMSLSFINHFGLSGITVENIGEATKALHHKIVGDSIGVRGPFGNWFKPIKGKNMIIGGGTGLAPLIPLSEVLKELGSKITFILGFKNHEEILFQNRIQKILTDKEDSTIIVTEDGSYGLKGLATDILEKLLRKEKYQQIYTCGPEPMMRKVFEISESKGIQIQACLERIIRCSIGLCGSCVIGKFRVCKNGLVLSSKQLRELKSEFGIYKKDFNGIKIAFSDKK